MENNEKKEVSSAFIKFCFILILSFIALIIAYLWKIYTLK